MSVIQSIRNKYIGFVVGAIVIALIGFLIMDAMQSNVSSVFGNDRSLLAEVNGKRIDYRSFEELRAKYEQNMKSRSKEGTITDEQKTQIQSQVWDDMVKEALMSDEMEKLGIELTDLELREMLTDPMFADQMIQQNFRDPNTGVFDPSRVQQYINNLGQDKTGEQRKEWADFQEALIKNRKMTKYTTLITKGIYIPKFMMDMNAKLKSATSSISYVNIPYTTISDSSIKVSDEDITTFMNTHIEMFKSPEASASVNYVSFDIIPSRDDSAQSLGVLMNLKEEFTTSANAEELVAKNSEESLKDFYYTEKNLEMPNPTEVISSAVGSVTGPVYMNGSYKMVKVMDKKSMPDSVKASHILIAINDKRNEESAKSLSDSLENVIKSGTPLEALATSMSDDKGSAVKGGDLGYFAQGMMVPEFNDACFNGKTGDLKVVKSDFGYHIIRITDQKDFKPAVKVAILSKSLVAGKATMDAAFAKANEFISKAKDAKTFTETAKSMNKDKRIAEYITKTQARIQGLGNARELSRWAFEAKVGNVSPIFNMDDKCIVATLNSRSEKGSLPAVDIIRPQIEGMLKKEKKGKMLIEKYKGKSSLEEIASLSQMMVKNADTVLYLGGGNQEIGYEPKIIGSAFNKTLVNKVSPGIAGESGVFFIKVKNLVEAPSAPNPMAEMERMQMMQQAQGQADQMIPMVLKKKAKINDNRSTFF
ncbi:MAG: peptidylprolyl isomerase [Chitinophagaceae bacterium]|nr:peptidylprolyl isomerase [Chitinophagaceae bacterium]